MAGRTGAGWLGVDVALVLITLLLNTGGGVECDVLLMCCCCWDCWAVPADPSLPVPVRDRDAPIAATAAATAAAADAEMLGRVMPSCAAAAAVGLSCLPAQPPLEPELPDLLRLASCRYTRLASRSSPKASSCSLSDHVLHLQSSAAARSCVQ